MPAIAELFIKVGADVSSAVTSLNGLNAQLTSFSGVANQALPASAALAGAAVGIGAGFAGAITAAADFEKQISGIKAVMTPADVQQFGAAIHDLALTLGKETKFSAVEAANGIEELVKAGVPVAAVLEGAAKSALALAAATGTPVADAAVIASQAMNAFRVSAKDLDGVVDFLAGTVNASAAGMEDIRFGLQSVGAVASTVGLSFRDTATALGLFANNGIRGQDAGTSLKTMLIGLIPDTKKQIETFKELGLITAEGGNQFFDAAGKVKPLVEIAGLLQSALSGMTEEQRLANLQLLFGTDAMRAAAILAKEGALGVSTLTTEIGKITAADSARTRLDNLSGSMEMLSGSMSALAVTIGERLLPVLRAIVDGTTSVVNAFLTLPEPVQNAILIIAGVAGVLTGIAAAIGLVSAVMGPLLVGFAALGSIFGILAGAAGVVLGILAAFALPIAAIAGALALLVIAWQNNWLDIQGITSRAFESIRPTLDALGGLLGAVGNLAGALAQRLGTELMGALGQVGTFINNTLKPAFEGLLAFLGELLSKIGGVISALLPPEVRAIFDKIGGAAGALPNAVGALTTGVNAAADAVRGTTTVSAPVTVNATVTNEADEQRLAVTIAETILASANRVGPPVPQGQPGVVTAF